MKRSIICAALFVGFVMILAPACPAADFPTKPVTLIVPTPAGGGRDVQARAFAPLAQKLLGQPVVVSNKPGANGIIGLLALAQSAPDGHTLGVSSPTDIEALLWETENGRKPAVNHDDFVYIGIITTSPHLLAVPYNSPWKTLADLIRDAKAKPGFYSFASSGVNAGTHLSAEFFIEATGLKFRHVPSRAAAKPWRPSSAVTSTSAWWSRRRRCSSSAATNSGFSPSRRPSVTRFFPMSPPSENRVSKGVRPTDSSD